MNKFGTIYVSIITVALVASLYVSSLSTSDAFVFTWTREEQKIVDGTLRIEISFTWQNESLNIIAKISGGKHYCDWLGFVFDRNGNGTIDFEKADKPYLLYGRPENWSYNLIPGHPSLIDPKLYEDQNPKLKGKDPYLVPCRCWYVSPYHTCDETEDGYLFNVTIPKTELANVKADVVLVTYQGAYAINAEEDWVTVIIEGWQ